MAGGPGGEGEKLAELRARADEIEAPPEPSRYRVLRRLVAGPDRYLAIGFGGGSVPGLAGNCALAVLLHELGVLAHVREIWGCSAGAFVGGALAGGVEPPELTAFFGEAAGERMFDVAWWPVLKGLVFRRPPDGVFRGRAIRRRLRKLLPVRTFEECSIPFRAIAVTDDGLARTVVLRSGSLADGIYASACLPGVFSPLPSWGGRGYLDGGLVEKTPLLSIIDEHRREGRREELLILASHFDDRAQVRRPRGFLQRFYSSFSVMSEIIWTHQLDRARAAEDARLLVLNPRVELGGRFDFRAFRDHYLWARRAFKDQLTNARLPARFSAR